MTRALIGSCLGFVTLAACGGGSGPKGPPCTSPTNAALTDPNVVALVVDPGPAQVATPYTNGLFTSVKVCVPGSPTECQIIDHLLVDTGSVGLRVLESSLTLQLPAVTTDAGLPLAECTPFVDGTAWGPIKLADVQVGQEVASNIPIQTVGEQTFPQVPQTVACSGVPVNTLNDLGSNGILGVGVYQQDCGTDCASGSRNRGLYFACSSATTCTTTTVPTTKQVPNPVAMFPVDNNGVIIQLPCLSPNGAPSAEGTLVFGIGTQTNNDLGAAQPMPLDPNGFVSTAYPQGGTRYTSYLDSGSNALFFLNAATASLRQCSNKNLTDFYCPPGLALLSADISGGGSPAVPVAFSVADASNLPPKSVAFNDLGGPMPGFPFDTTVPGFDWGLPFYFGRSVYTAIEGQPTPAGPGPYFAF